MNRCDSSSASCHAPFDAIKNCIRGALRTQFPKNHFDILKKKRIYTFANISIAYATGNSFFGSAHLMWIVHETVGEIIVS